MKVNREEIDGTIMRLESRPKDEYVIMNKLTDERDRAITL